MNIETKIPPNPQEGGGRTNPPRGEFFSDISHWREGVHLLGHIYIYIYVYIYIYIYIYIYLNPLKVEAQDESQLKILHKDLSTNLGTIEYFIDNFEMLFNKFNSMVIEIAP